MSGLQGVDFEFSQEDTRDAVHDRIPVVATDEEARYDMAVSLFEFDYLEWGGGRRI